MRPPIETNGLDNFRKISLRFINIGILTTGTYFALVLILARWGGLEKHASVAIAYLGVLPLNYYGHRTYTFKSDSTIPKEVFKYLAAHVVILTLTQIALYAAKPIMPSILVYFHVCAAAIIFCISFAIMRLFVFRQ